MIFSNNNITSISQAVEAVKKDSFAIQKVPEEFIVPKVTFAAVEHCGSALKYIDWSKHTRELCLIAVQNYGRALKYVRPELQTPELCMAAIKQSIFALKYVEDNNLKILLASYHENNKNTIKIVEDESGKTTYVKTTYVKTKSGVEEYIKILYTTVDEIKSVAELDNKDTGYYYIRLEDHSYDVYKVTAEKRTAGWFWLTEVVSRNVQKVCHLEQIHFV